MPKSPPKKIKMYWCSVCGYLTDFTGLCGYLTDTDFTGKNKYHCISCNKFHLRVNYVTLFYKLEGENKK